MAAVAAAAEPTTALAAALAAASIAAASAPAAFAAAHAAALAATAVPAALATSLTAAAPAAPAFVSTCTAGEKHECRACDGGRAPRGGRCLAVTVGAPRGT